MVLPRSACSLVHSFVRQFVRPSAWPSSERPTEQRAQKTNDTVSTKVTPPTNQDWKSSAKLDPSELKHRKLNQLDTIPVSLLTLTRNLRPLELRNRVRGTETASEQVIV